MNQPAPQKNDRPLIADDLCNLIQERKQKGLETYGVGLQPFNGRDALQDALEESIDLSKYLLQAKIELDELLKAVDEAVSLWNGCEIRDEVRVPPSFIYAMRELRSLRQQQKEGK